MGPAGEQQVKSIAVTMRTPDHDLELAAGFLMREGVIQDVDDIEAVAYVNGARADEPGMIRRVADSFTAARQECRLGSVSVARCSQHPQFEPQLLYNLELRRLW
jgi:formate dehydrogenase assembly factor FdhD